MFSTKRFLASFLGIAVGLAAATTALAKEEKVQLADCPPAVQKTIQANLAGGSILGIDRDTDAAGVMVFDADIKLPDGKTCEISVAADGKLLKTENAEEEKKAGDKTELKKDKKEKKDKGGDEDD